MTKTYQTGDTVSGKVTGIQPYGAFVALDEEVQGLVHISEITHGFVKDINEHLSVGDQVKVKVLNVDEQKNKVSLSIRQTEEPVKETNASKPKRTPAPAQKQEETSGFNTLKEKLQEWIEQSEQREGTFKN